MKKQSLYKERETETDRQMTDREIELHQSFKYVRFTKEFSLGYLKTPQSSVRKQMTSRSKI